jgi:hypothetical protein
VEVDVSQGLPTFATVGLPDRAVRESRERVRTAIRNSGFAFPLERSQSISAIGMSAHCASRSDTRAAKRLVEAEVAVPAMVVIGDPARELIKAATARKVALISAHSTRRMDLSGPLTREPANSTAGGSDEEIVVETPENRHGAAGIHVP